MPDVAEIAGRLSDAQRRLILSAMPFESHTGKPLWRIPGRWGHDTQVAFSKAGVVVMNVLTRRGSAVRAYLESSRVTD